jgi:hypothetical protein
MSEPREPYEPPAIDDREPIDTPLVAVTSGEVPTAAFHPVDGDDEYEPPAIDQRDQIDTALIGAVGSGEPTSAAFHPASEYEPPRIDEREPIDGPLVAFGSGPVGV